MKGKIMENNELKKIINDAYENSNQIEEIKI